MENTHDPADGHRVRITQSPAFGAGRWAWISLLGAVETLPARNSRF